MKVFPAITDKLAQKPLKDAADSPAVDLWRKEGFKNHCCFGLSQLWLQPTHTHTHT